MEKAHSYWSLASRTLSPTALILNPSPILFRPENVPPVSDGVESVDPIAATSLGSDSPRPPSGRTLEIELTQDRNHVLSQVRQQEREVNLSSSPTPMGLSQTAQRFPSEAPQLNSKMPLAVLPRTTELAQVNRDSFSTPILRPSTSSSLTESKALHIPSTPVERVIPLDSIEKELPTTAVDSRLWPATEMPRVESARVEVGKISKSTSEFMGESKGKHETLPRLHPPLAPAVLQSVSPVDSSLRSETTHELNKSDAPPVQALDKKMDLRIGSIVVHIEKPAPPPPARRPSAPAAMKPGGALARGFSSFGFHQN